jgi:hypothetical protein
VVLKQPNSSIIIHPKANISFKSIIPVEIGFSWKLNYFPEPYQWDQIDINAHYLVYSRLESSYYVIPYIFLITRGNNGGLQLAPETSPVIHHSMTRVDNTATVDISIPFYNNNTGSLKFRSSLSKTWSSLATKVPIDIQEWFFSASLEWRFKNINVINRL